MDFRKAPKFNPDDMHMTLMSADFGCTHKQEITQAVIECIEHNNYQTDPVYLVQCLGELYKAEQVETIKKHFNL